jgi:hypothetical protein
MPAVTSTVHDVFSSCGGQIVNARKPATAVVPVTVGTGIEFGMLASNAICGIHANSRNSRESRERDRDLFPFYFIFRNLEMAEVLLDLKSIPRSHDVVPQEEGEQ